MASPGQKIVSTLVAATIAFFSMGNLAVHRIAGSWHCHCFEAASHAHLACGCSHAKDEAPQDDSRDASLRGDESCVICDFYRQAMERVTALLIADLEAPVESLVAVPGQPVELSVLPAFWSRGPPTNA